MRRSRDEGCYPDIIIADPCECRLAYELPLLCQERSSVVLFHREVPGERIAIDSFRAGRMGINSIASRESELEAELRKFGTPYAHGA